MLSERLRNEELKKRIVTADEAASWIENGMTVGLSGFTKAGDTKEVPYALVERAKKEGKPFKIDVYTGASLGGEIDGLMAEAGIIRKRLPFQVDTKMRNKINSGGLMFIDQHLSHTAEFLRTGAIKKVDIAVIEAIAITEEGYIVPSTSVGNSSNFVQQADQVIVELNMAQPLAFEGTHDIYDPGMTGHRQPIPLTEPNQKIGLPYIKVDSNKIKGIVITNKMDITSAITPPDAETAMIANHLMDFLKNEVEEGRLPNNLAPLQSGIGAVANAVFHGFLDSDFEDLEVYSEVLQDAVFDVIDAGKIKTASCCSITLSPDKMAEVYGNYEKYRDKIVLRPQEISNHPEVIRRLGLICMNTALEVDIYGNVNSTHVNGSKMMNGIGGSGDFARNGRLAIFVTKSLAKGGAISSVVPFVSHVDHTEHDVDVLVTEQGLADLRGLAPKERAMVVIQNCAHPMYRPQLMEYYKKALTRGGQTPHIIGEALSWHERFINEGTMLEQSQETVKA